IEYLKQSETPLPPQEVLFEQIIERMIIEEIQLQKAQRAGVRISDQELNESMAQIAQGNGLSLQDFRSFLEEQGESYEFVREQVRKEMILSRIQRGLVQSKVYISEQELDNFIKSQEGQVNLSAEFLIQQILIPINRDQDEETASSIIDSL
ncbi:MAG: SurA N-terminal domain-containing protein, partial [Gammaproteobacteria bacterium]